MPTSDEISATCQSIKQEVLAAFAERNQDSFWDDPSVAAGLSFTNSGIDVHFIAHRANEPNYEGWWEVWDRLLPDIIHGYHLPAIRAFAANAAASLDRFRNADWKADRERRKMERYQEGLDDGTNPLAL